MTQETVFSKIIRREVPADILFQDDLVTAFRDTDPMAPVHVLIIPNEQICTLSDITANHEALLARLLTTAVRIAQQEGVSSGGYRLIINCNRHAGQQVPHLHLHLLGGRMLGPLLSP